MIRLCQFTGGGSSTVKGGRQELKVREVGEQRTGGGRFWPPCPPPPPQSPEMKYLPFCDKRNQTQPSKRKWESLSEI